MEVYAALLLFIAEQGYALVGTFQCSRIALSDPKHIVGQAGIRPFFEVGRRRVSAFSTINGKSPTFTAVSVRVATVAAVFSRWIVGLTAERHPSVTVSVVVARTS